jgi:hypothetical protein
MEQLEPAAKVDPHALEPVLSAKSLALAPVMLGTMLFSAASPVLDNVADSTAEVVPVCVLGKLNAGLSDATGAVPVPVSVAFCGAVPPLTPT